MSHLENLLVKPLKTLSLHSWHGSCSYDNKPCSFLPEIWGALLKAYAVLPDLCMLKLNGGWVLLSAFFLVDTTNEWLAKNGLV